MSARILYFLSSPVRGGVEEHVLSLIKHLDRQRFSPMLVCPRALLETLRDDLAAVPVECIPLHIESPARPRHWINAVRLYRLLRRRRPDIVNCHLLRATLIGATIAALARVPVIIETFHGREAQREGRGGIKGSFILDRIVNRFVTHVITVSQASKRHLVEVKGFNPLKISVVYNGRDLTVYRSLPQAAVRAARQELGIDPGAPVLGVIGRLDHQKGHEYLLAALPQVLNRVPRARLLVVGGGNLRETLQARARQLGVDSGAIFTGFRPDVPRMIAVMDVVVLPSLYEGLPLTVIEASAMGKPVVATAVDGTPEVVVDGVTGILVPPRDPETLAKAILRLLEDPGLAGRLGEAGRKFIRGRFNLQRQVEATEKIYEACLCRPGATAGDMAMPVRDMRPSRTAAKLGR